MSKCNNVDGTPILCPDHFLVFDLPSANMVILGQAAIQSCACSPTKYAPLSIHNAYLKHSLDEDHGRAGDGDNRLCLFGPSSDADQQDPTLPEPWSLLTSEHV